MKVSFTGAINPHIYIGKEKFVPVQLKYGDGRTADVLTRYQPAKFTCELTDDENGNDIRRFHSTVNLLHLEKYVDKENPNKITAEIGFYHVINTENRFCQFSLNKTPIVNRKSVDLLLLHQLSECAKIFGKDKELSANQRGLFNAMSMAYDTEVETHRIWHEV